MFPSRFRGLARSRRILALVDQLLQSGATFGAMLAAARVGESAEFAAYAIAYAVTAVCLGVQRSLIFLPLLNQKGCSDSDFHSLDWSTWLLGSAILGGFFFFALYLCLAAASIKAPWALFCVAMVPSHLLYEAARRSAYLEGESAKATAVAAIFSVGLGSCALIGLIWKSVDVIVWGFTAAGCASALYYFAGSHRRALAGILATHESYGQWRGQARNTLWHLSSFGAHSVYTTGFPILCGIFGGPVVVAVAAATRNLITPVLTFITAIDAVEKPAAAIAYRDKGIAGLSASVRKTRVRMASVVIPLSLFVALAAHWLLDIAYGERYKAEWRIGILWGAFAIFSALNQSQETSLIVLRMAKRIAYAKFTAAAFFLLLIAPLTYKLGAAGAVLACTGAMFINLGIAGFLARRAIATDTSPP